MLPHRFQCLARPRASAEALDAMSRLVGVARRAEDEYDLARLPRGQIDPGLYRGARIQAGTRAVRQALAAHRRRAGQRAVAADELGTVSAHRALRFVHVGKDHAVSAGAAVGIAGKQCSALRIRFGHDVHQVGVTPFAEHQFPVPGQRQAARAPRLVAQRDHHELHRGVHGHVGEHFRGDAGLVMLEHAVSEPVPAHVAGAAARGQRRR